MLDSQKLQKLGLLQERIEKHQKRLKDVLLNGQSTSLPVVAPCTVSQGSILSWKMIADWVGSIAYMENESFFYQCNESWVKKSCGDDDSGGGRGLSFFITIA